MNIFKKASQIICILLIFSFIPVTGCSKLEDFREDIESRMDEKRKERKEQKGRKEDEGLHFSTAHDFEDYYGEKISKALKSNKKTALKDLFCETVLENTYDMNEGLDYLFGLEDWSGFIFSEGNCSSRKEYSGEGRWEFVSCRMNLTKGDVKYRIFYSGYAAFYEKEGGKSRSIGANLGLANLCIGKLNSKGAFESPIYNFISGIGHPGRDKAEKIVITVLNTYETVLKDGSYFETVTDEALAEIMTDNLKNGADKSELEAFIKFIRIASISKKCGYFYFIRKEGSAVSVTGTFRFTLKDRCITMLIKDGKIDGVTVIEGKDEPKAQSGKIKGFTNTVK